MMVANKIDAWLIAGITVAAVIVGYAYTVLLSTPYPIIHW